MAMDPHHAIASLERLRDEADALQHGPVLAGDLRRWYDDVLDILDQIYGQDSSTRQAFEHIQFGFPPESFQRGAELLRVELQRHGIDLPESFSIPLSDYYQTPLREATEFLSSEIIKLRPR